MSETLTSRLLDSALRHRGRPAVHVGAQTWSYESLIGGALEVADALSRAGIGPGDRVAIWMEKSSASLRVLLGTLLAGAAYVPIDPKAPAPRALAIAGNAAVAALAVDPLRCEAGDALASQVASIRLRLFAGEGPLASEAPDAVRDAAAFDARVRAYRAPRIDPEQPAYILYTSGSTGVPKGVVLSHRAALSFVDWCIDTFHPTPDDRMSSHAPFHFDLSTFDLFVTLASGASVRLLSSSEAMFAPWIVRQLAGWGITFWYSVPSALIAMLEQGGLSASTWPGVRTILFAGEVYPTPALRKLRRALPGVRLVNLYGPTETNVCTWYEVGDIPDEQTAAIPIGRVCENLHGAILDAEMKEVERGAEGDLWIGGGNLMTAYWNDPSLTAGRLKRDPRPGHDGLIYNTGDRVREASDGNLIFLGRKDHMVKVRGYRVELGEVESALHSHPSVAEAAVVPVPDGEAGQKLVAWVALRGAETSAAGGRGAGKSPDAHADLAGATIDEAALQAFVRDRLPLYMVPARVRLLEALPRTSTGKTDRVNLTTRAIAED